MSIPRNAVKLNFKRSLESFVICTYINTCVEFQKITSLSYLVKYALLVLCFIFWYYFMVYYMILWANTAKNLDNDLLIRQIDRIN